MARCDGGAGLLAGSRSGRRNSGWSDKGGPGKRKGSVSREETKWMWPWVIDEGFFVARRMNAWTTKRWIT
jgi:hypothetical protein